MAMHDDLKKTSASPAYYREKVWRRRARFYDPFLKLVFLPCGGESSFRRRCVDFASPAAEDQVLDVCCGTGTLTSLIAGRVGPHGQVIGVDMSESALEIAREKTPNVPLTFQRAEAENLPFASARFDKCFISFGLHEMPKQARQNTLREIRRTLRSGGCLFVVDYNLPAGVLARLVLQAFVKLVEDEAAYEMLLDDSLVAEVEAGGLAIKRREIICSRMIQLIEARKP
jgi:demethylmenaquinone methyltransferase/2-methoxy-6-polyprenyl-1,4-benzoquinol methylase